jgi:hypothetical protein
MKKHEAKLGLKIKKLLLSATAEVIILLFKQILWTDFPVNKFRSFSDWLYKGLDIVFYNSSLHFAKR